MFEFERFKRVLRMAIFLRYARLGEKNSLGLHRQPAALSTSTERVSRSTSVVKRKTIRPHDAGPWKNPIPPGR